MRYNTFSEDEVSREDIQNEIDWVENEIVKTTQMCKIFLETAKRLHAIDKPNEEYKEDQITIGDLFRYPKQNFFDIRTLLLDTTRVRDPMGWYCVTHW